MSPNLPVPSKGALRTLRNLALGTSVTVAFSAGLLTEDRRRRIHVAREVHDNAKKLQSSRKYHSAGNAVLERFEEQVLRYQDEALWLPSNVLRSSSPTIIRPDKQNTLRKQHLAAGQATQSRAMPKLPLPNLQPFIDTHLSQFTPVRRLQKYEIPQMPKHKSHNRQIKLSSNISKLLQESPPNIEAATLRFVEAFDEGMGIYQQGVLEPLMRTAIDLAKACRETSNFIASDRILEIILKQGPLAADHFYQFEPGRMIQRLIDRSCSDEIPLDPAKLRMATDIYLTPLKERTKTMPPDMVKLGQTLCIENSRSGRDEIVVRLCERLISRSSDGFLPVVHHKIRAHHRLGNHKKIFQIFRTFYTKTSPDQSQFYETVTLVFDSALYLGKFDQAEQIANAAAHMAESNGLLLSTSWLCKVIGHEWRLYHDLTKTRGLFERLKPVLRVAGHPKAFYACIIQFSVEAKEEALAQQYYQDMRLLYPEISPKDLAIYGHFALAKAYRGDWDRVKEDFRKMKQLAPFEDEMFASSFLPVLISFSKAHSLPQTELFIQYFVHHFDLKVNSYIMNFMVDLYGKGKELDAVSRFIEYSITQESVVTAVTIRTILNYCSRSYNMPFWDIYILYQKFVALNNEHPTFVDEATVAMMRSIAVRNKCGAEEKQRRLDALDASRGCSPDSRNILHSMSAAMARGEPDKTVEIYELARMENIPLEPRHLSAAVSAALQLGEGDFDRAAQLIRDASQRCWDVSAAITSVFIHRLTSIVKNSEHENIAELTEETVTTFAKHGIKVTAPVITHTTSLLHNQGQPHAALDFFQTMSRRLGLSSSTFDLATLTVLLRTYIMIQDSEGVRWIIQMLVANKLVPDNHFYRLLQNCRRSLANELAEGPFSSRKQNFFDAILEAETSTKLLRQDSRDDHEFVKLKVMDIIERAALQGRKARRVSIIGVEKEYGNDSAVPTQCNIKSGSVWHRRLSVADNSALQFS